MPLQRIEVTAADIQHAVFTRGDLSLKAFELLAKLLQNQTGFTITRTGERLQIAVMSDRPMRAALGMDGAREGDVGN